jgi:actin-related protein
MRQAAVVIHTGSLNTVVGFAGEEAPRAAFASVVGQPRHPGVMQGAVGNRQDSFDRSCVGERARRLAGIFLVKHPVMHGIVTDWAGAEKLWAHALYTELRLERGEHPVLLTEQALNPKANHERMVAVLFEALDVPAACVATEQVLSLAAAGHGTGLALSCGARVTHSTPVFEGYDLPHATIRLDLGGEDLTDCLLAILCERDDDDAFAGGQGAAREAKEALGRVSMSYYEDAVVNHPFRENRVATLTEHQLRDGTTLSLGSSERCRCTEPLFQPSLTNVRTSPAMGVPHAICTSIMRCDLSIRADLFRNILLCGGGARLEGMAERVAQDVGALALGRCSWLPLCGSALQLERARARLAFAGLLHPRLVPNTTIFRLPLTDVLGLVFEHGTTTTRLIQVETADSAHSAFRGGALLAAMPMEDTPSLQWVTQQQWTAKATALGGAEPELLLADDDGGASSDRAASSARHRTRICWATRAGQGRRRLISATR